MLSIALSLDFLAAVAFSAVEHINLLRALYWAVATATTVGYGDVTATTTGGVVLTIIVMLTVIPLFGATFSLLTSGLAQASMTASEQRIKAHVNAGEQRIKAHVEQRLTHHLNNNGDSSSTT